MQFQVTNSGLAAAFAAGNQGPAIRISQFRVGTGFGYLPEVSDAALRGDELFRDTPRSYRVLDTNTSEFTVVMDETVGTWQFGEIGLYQDTGELFALGTLTRQQWKAAFPDRDYNRYNIKIRLTLNGAIPKIELVVEDFTLGMIQELPSVDYLPLIDSAVQNAYICHSTDIQGNEAFATLGADRWTINTHMGVVFTGTIAAKNVSGTLITSAGLALNNPSSGMYLVQFLSGSAKGAVRQVNSFQNGELQWTVPEHNIVIGDEFQILNGDSSSGDSSDDAFFYSLLGR